MAPPVIVSVNPSTGRTGGRVLVEIWGSGFRLPPPPPRTGPAPTPLPSVRVDFIGYDASTKQQVTRASPRVRVLSPTRLVVTTPALDPGAHDMRVTNVDAAGVDVFGESAIAAAAYTAKRPNLTSETTLTRVVAEVVRDLKKQVHENVVIFTDTDFDAAPGDLARPSNIATLPAIVLVGPRLITERMYASEDLRNVQDASNATLFDVLRPPKTRSLSFRLVVATQGSTAELLGLMSEVERYFQRNPYLEMDRSPVDPAQGRVRYEFQQPIAAEFDTGGVPNNNNVHQAETSFFIRGVDIDEADMRIGIGTALGDYAAPGTDTTAVPPSGIVLGTAPAGAPPETTPLAQPPNGLTFEQFDQEE